MPSKIPTNILVRKRCIVVIDWIWMDQVLAPCSCYIPFCTGSGLKIYNYRLRTGSVVNYSSYLGAPEYLSRCKLQIVLGQVWRNHKMQLTLYGCFDFLNIYTTTKCKWYFMLDASTNSTYTTTKCKWGIELNNFWTISERWTIKNEWNYKRLGTFPFFYTKRSLAGNL